MLSPDDLPTLAVFAEVVDRRSFTAAAAAVGLAKSGDQPSHRVARDSAWASGCCDAPPGVVSPTEEGRRLYQHCAQLVAAARGPTWCCRTPSGTPRCA